MYKSHFGLQRNPFEISPDPAFLYSTERHQEALASLYYGVRKRSGFVVLTGEVGTGKTLIVRCLLEILSKNHVASAYVFNPRLTPVQLLQYICGDLGLETSRSKAEMLLHLNQFLIDRHRQDLETVLIVDEAHLLEPELLEEVRLLTNLETSQQKLLQIVLAGQPELDKVLDSRDLRQLKQRITYRCKLMAFTLSDTRGYLKHRLAIAGAGERSGTIFPEETVEVVHRYSYGIPRLINTVCENALISSYALRLDQVPPTAIEEVACDLRLRVRNGQMSKREDPLDLNEILTHEVLPAYGAHPSPANGGSVEKFDEEEVLVLDVVPGRRSTRKPAKSAKDEDLDMEEGAKL